MVNIQQNKLKLQCTNLTQKAIHLHMETWIQVSFLLQKGYCFFQLRGSLPKCRRRCASGNVTECSSILLLLKAQSPLTVLVSSVQREVKGIAVQQGNLPVNLQVISVHTPQYWERQADFSWEHKILLSYLKWGGKKLPSHPEHPSLYFWATCHS